MQAPWPQAWEEILAETAHDWVLSADQLKQWRQLIRILVAEKKWEGCDGFTITDRVKVTIASQTALMILGMPHDYFTSVRSVVVFPSAFELPQEDWQEKAQTVLGLAAHGAVLLAWDKVLAGSQDVSSGRNVVIHEFAHHLDLQDGYWNGCPELRTKVQRAQWYQAMNTVFTNLRWDLMRGRNVFFGDNAGNNPTEFFAEASERFFCVPAQLRHFHPEVYDVLEQYYGLKTMEWFEER